MNAVARARNNRPARHWTLTLFVLGFGCMALGLAGLVQADEWDQAKRMHDRIAGVPPDDTTLISMRDELLASRPIAAALIATQRKTVRTTTTPATAGDQRNREPTYDE